MAVSGPARNRLRPTGLLPERTSSLREYAERARARAVTTRSTVIDILGQERKQMHQHLIDIEIVDTERTISSLFVAGRDRYPALEVLDPYFLASADQQTLLTGLLDAALAGSSADRGNIQLFDPALSGLRIAAHRGFEDPFLTFFDRVGAAGSACAAAATAAAPVHIPDVARSPVFDPASRATVLDARARAVQSIPLVDPTGRVLGVLSCHYEKPDPPMEDDERLLLVLAEAAVKALRWQRSRTNGTGIHGT